MRNNVQEITRRSLNEMQEIYEFRAFTQLAYLTFEDVGRKLSNANHPWPISIQPIDKTYDQLEVTHKLQSYNENFLPQLSFQHSITIFESWLSS
jgi:hypothetical protein